MKNKYKDPEPFTPRWISKAEANEPQFVLQDFFDNHTPDEVERKMWSLLVTALSSDNGDFQTGVDRSGILFMYEGLRKLIEAAYVIRQIPYP